MHSNCTLQVLSTYFISGQVSQYPSSSYGAHVDQAWQLPASGDKQCAVNQPLFSLDEHGDMDDQEFADGLTAVPESASNTTSATNKKVQSGAVITLSPMSAVIHSGLAILGLLFFIH